MNLNVYNYNNYINRIVKFENNLLDYGTPIYTQTGVNFKPNNEINTTQILNYDGTGNYLVVYDDDNNIVSRWFIIDSERTRQGQYELSLKRDVVVDNYNLALNSPMIINRGMVNHNNSLVFNDEGFSFNQIKQSETLIRDRHSYYPYIVLYCAKNMTSKSGISVSTSFTGNFDLEISTPLENSIYKAGTYNSSAQSMDLLFQFTAQYSTHGVSNNWRFYKYTTSNGNLVDDGASPYPPQVSPITQNIISNNTTGLKNPLNTALSSSHMTQVLSAYKNGQTGKITDADKAIYDNIISTGGLKIKDSTGKFYQITATRTTKTNSNIRISPSVSGYNNLVNYIKDEFPEFTPNDLQPSTTSFYPFYATTTEYEYTLYAEYLANETFTVDVDPTGKVHTDDSECNIILFPYDNITVVTDGTHYITIDRDTQLNIARTIAREYTNSVIYDMQLLPYAPPSFLPCASYNTLHLEVLDEKQYTTFEYNNELKGVMLWADVSNFSYNINMPITVNENAIDYKIASNCDLYRLCSPNYNGQFEFNVAKNGGIDYFNIDVTYRPYNPYIHINPNFKNMYGNDYNDCRGLICQGDFSLPITGDAFAQYELNNKNYLNVFNRNIEHMDFENKYAMRDATIGAITGTLGGITQGAMVGAMSGGGVYGAIAGGVIGGVTSLTGGVIDISTLRDKQRENKTLAVDMFNYQLGNVKALPYSINKVTPLTYNNKIFPILEYYTCTDVEKDILRNKIKYNSMGLNIIDTISNLKLNYTEDNDIHFYSGNLIRIEDSIEEQVADDLYNELMKGVYV